MLSLLLAATATTRANDYLEIQSHYSIYSIGLEAIHVKVPLWAYGRVNNYYIANGSYLYFKYKGSKDKWFAVYFRADQKGENDVNNGKGSGEVFITPGRGNIIITNTNDGVRQQVNESEGWKKFVVKQGAVDDCSQLTSLEFDWYPPESLNGSAGGQIPGPNDLVAAFSGETCLGVAQYIDGLYFLYIANPPKEANQAIDIRYYSATLKNIFVAKKAFTFIADECMGSVSAPLEPSFLKID